MLVVNIFGAPNSGKSLLASNLFSKLKMEHIKVENVQEVVKIAHYEQDMALLNNDLRILAEKNRILDALSSAGVDIAIMDGPVLNSMVYKFGKHLDHFDPLVLDIHHSFNNVNFFLPGVKNFSASGRYENNVEEAMERGNQVFNMLRTNGIELVMLHGNEFNGVVEFIKEKLAQQKKQSIKM